MAANHHSDIDVMLYADGELSESEARALKDAVSDDTEVASRVAGVEELGEAVRTLVETRVDDADEAGRFDGLWQRIAEGIEADAAAEPAAAMARKRPGVAAEAQPGLWQTIREWLSGHGMTTGLVAAGAVAVLFVALRPFERVVERQVEVVREVPTDRGTSEVAPAGPRMVSQPAEVEDLEVYDGNGMILTIPGDGDDDNPTTVIWISNDDTIEGPI